MLTVIYTILIFGAIIFIHEFGHFIAARLCGVKVNEFALGMGPKLLKFKGKNTLYSLRLFPIGGFCSMEGEDPEGEAAVMGAAGSEDAPEEAIPPQVLTEEERAAEEKRARRNQPFYTKSVWQRILICLAGPFMNLLLGFVIILSLTATQEYYASNVVKGFREQTPPGLTDLLQVGDRIVKVNKTTVLIANDIPFELQRDGDGKVDLTVIRNGEKLVLKDVNFLAENEEGKQGLLLGFYVSTIQPGFFSTIAEAGKETISLARNSWVSVGDLFTGKVGFQDLSGPVGVGQYVGEAAKVGFKSLINLVAFISISIGMFNVLPFPALDGGRVVFLGIEAIRRKPINPKWEGYVNTVGLLLLFGLMIVVTLKDIFKLF